MRMVVLDIRYFLNLFDCCCWFSFLFISFCLRPHCFLLNQFYFQSSQVSGVRFLFFDRTENKIITPFV